ncbi:Uncharacterised protein [Ralstonia pickettii]|uniref:hypothetical protein n=1 Tax=Ralstonia TaxID=48736 RepID=UPI0001E6918E|nr:MULTISPECIES: hypothetical protein [Ralstonia]EFP66149.1 hypothetical protein HMPREF1004_02160 [Ralstonia pickettii]EGY62951.1 hypothetical protein HMPREF0989_03446 [Ralstonia sp. 5_2_56FAA]KFL21769.1 putative proline-alanine-aspartic repeated domain-containing containing protein [Ralstonia pickettii]MBU6521403.1 hypothetical protein [Ralstonia sp. B265]NPT50895.1 hypothetical protein [Ralstonia sp. 3N]
MLVTTNVLIKTEDGREALAQRRHDMQMRQRHLLILIDGARTVGQLHQLLSDWPDLDDLLVGLQRAGMVDVLPGISPENAATAPPFDPIAHFNRPLFDDHGSPGPAALSHIYDELPPLTGMTLGLQAVAAPIDEPAANDASKPHTAPVQVISAPQPAVPPELADVLPNVVKVELMRLAVQHFGSAAGAAMPLLRACKEDPQSLCDVVAACARAAAPLAGEHAAAKFVDAAMQAMALRR